MYEYNFRLLSSPHESQPSTLLDQDTPLSPPNGDIKMGAATSPLLRPAPTFPHLPLNFGPPPHPLGLRDVINGGGMRERGRQEKSPNRVVPPSSLGKSELPTPPTSVASSPPTTKGEDKKPGSDSDTPPGETIPFSFFVVSYILKFTLTVC